MIGISTYMQLSSSTMTKSSMNAQVRERAAAQETSLAAEICIKNVGSVTCAAVGIKEVDCNKRPPRVTTDHFVLLISLRMEGVIPLLCHMEG
jgi:hypothetical protein